MENLGIIVLCGGGSRRMGRPKEWLPIGEEVLLQRVVGCARERARLVVVAAAPGQSLPPLPRDVEVVRDPEPGLGPLQGVATSLAALAGRVEWAFVTASDAPLLLPGWIDRLRSLADGFDLVLPRVKGRDHPLSALYRPEVAGPAASRLLALGSSRLGLLQGEVRTRIVPAEELADVDPEFQTLRNLNCPEDYEAFLGPG